MLGAMWSWLRKHRKDLSEIWAPITSIVSSVLVVATVVLAAATYWQQQGLAAAQASLAYVERFSSGEVLEARNLIYSTWLPYDFSALETIEPSVADALVDGILTSSDQRGQGIPLRVAVAEIVAFFDGVNGCGEIGVCDRTVLQAQMGEYARDFYCLYKGALQKEAKLRRLPSFGRGLEAFANAAGADCPRD